MFYVLDWRTLVYEMSRKIDAISQEMAAQTVAFRSMQNAFNAMQRSHGGGGLVFSKGPSELLGVTLPLGNAKEVAEIDRKLAANQELQMKVVSIMRCNDILGIQLEVMQCSVLAEIILQTKNWCVILACFFFFQGKYLAGLGGDKPSTLVHNVMMALMTPRCARFFNWTGSVFSATDMQDKIIPVDEHGALCTHKSQFSRYTSIIGVVLVASDCNLAYPEGCDKSHHSVTEKIKKFFNHAAEKDPGSVAYKKKKANDDQGGPP